MFSEETLPFLYSLWSISAVKFSVVFLLLTTKKDCLLSCDKVCVNKLPHFWYTFCLCPFPLYFSKTFKMEKILFCYLSTQYKLIETFKADKTYKSKQYEIFTLYWLIIIKRMCTCYFYVDSGKHVLNIHCCMILYCIKIFCLFCVFVLFVNIMAIFFS